jgi:hypothetical protein
MDRGIWPSEWRAYGSKPRLARDNLKTVAPMTFRGWFRFGTDYASIGGGRYELRGLLEHKFGVRCENGGAGSVQLDAGGDGVLRWWVQGDAAPTGPESGGGGGGGGESDGSGGSFPPMPAAKYAPRFDDVGATLGKLGGGTHWNEMTSKGMPKIVLASKYNGKVAWVTVWGSYYTATLKRYGTPEHPDGGGPRQRFYVTGAVPRSVMIRLHIPDGTDVVFKVANTSERSG